MILTAKEKAKIKERFFMECIDQDAKIIPERFDKFIEELVRVGYDYYEEKNEEELQALEGRKRAREAKADEES